MMMMQRGLPGGALVLCVCALVVLVDAYSVPSFTGAENKVGVFAGGDMLHDSGQWFYIDETNNQAGPITLDELKGKVYNNEITKSTRLWCSGLETWTEYSEIHKLKEYVSKERAYDPRSELLFDADGFISEIKEFEAKITSSAGNNDLFCTKHGALTKVLTKAKLKDMLMDVLVEVKQVEVEKVKLKKRLVELQTQLSKTVSGFNSSMEIVTEGSALLRQNLENIRESYTAEKASRTRFRTFRIYGDVLQASLRMNAILFNKYVGEPLMKIGGFYVAVGAIVFLLFVSKLLAPSQPAPVRRTHQD